MLMGKPSGKFPRVYWQPSCKSLRGSQQSEGFKVFWQRPNKFFLYKVSEDIASLWQVTQKLLAIGANGKFLSEGHSQEDIDYVPPIYIQRGNLFSNSYGKS